MIQSYQYFNEQVSKEISKHFGRNNREAWERQVNARTLVSFRNSLFLLKKDSVRGELAIKLIQIKLRGVGEFYQDDSEKTNLYNINLVDTRNASIIIRDHYDIKVEIFMNPSKSQVGYITIVREQRIFGIFLLNFSGEDFKNLQDSDRPKDLFAFRMRTYSQNICAVGWYPFSQSHICVLEQNQKFYAYNYMIDLQSPIICLNLKRFGNRSKYVDFKFKKGINLFDLSAFTLFLLTDNQQIHTIQPLILDGMRLDINLFNNLRRKLLDNQFGNQYQRIFQILSNKTSKIVIRQEDDEVVFHVNQEFYDYYATYLISNTNQQEERGIYVKNYRFQILQGFNKMTVFFLMKEFEDEPYHKIQCFLYAKEIGINQGEQTRMYKMFELNLETNLESRFIEQIDPNSYANLLNLLPIHNRIFIQSFNRIYSLDIGCLIEFENDFSLKGLRGIMEEVLQLTIFSEFDLKTREKSAEDCGFYGALLDQDNIYMIKRQGSLMIFEMHMTIAALNAEDYQYLSRKTQFYFKQQQIPLKQKQQKTDNTGFNLKNIKKSDIRKVVQSLSQDNIDKIQKSLAEVKKMFKELMNLKKYKQQNFDYERLINKVIKIKEKNIYISKIFEKKVQETKINPEMAFKMKKQELQQQKVQMQENLTKMNNIVDELPRIQPELMKLRERVQTLRLSLSELQIM